MAGVVGVGYTAYQNVVGQLSEQYNIPAPILTAMVQTESSWNPAVQNSKAGAIGLAQLMPGTAAQLGVNPYDPISNLTGGAKYLSSLYTKFGNWTDALAAYNGGPGNVSGSSEQSYAAKVIGTAQKLGYTGTGSASDAGTLTASADTLGDALTNGGPLSVNGAISAVYGGLGAIMGIGATAGTIAGDVATSGVNAAGTGITGVMDSIATWVRSHLIAGALGFIALIVILYSAIKLIPAPVKNAVTSVGTGTAKAVAMA